MKFKLKLTAAEWQAMVAILLRLPPQGPRQEVYMAVLAELAGKMFKKQLELHPEKNTLNLHRAEAMSVVQWLRTTSYHSLQMTDFEKAVAYCVIAQLEPKL